MSEVKKYNYRELSPAKSTGAVVKKHKMQQFTSQVSEVVTATADQRRSGFSLDNLVANHIGVEEREQKAFEALVEKEIELRWEKTKEKAEVNGYTAGLAEGKEQAFKAELPRIKERLDRLDHLVLEMDSFREKIFQANESFIMDLVAQMARMIVLREVEFDKEYLRRVILSLIRQVGTTEDTKILISEQDSDNIQTLSKYIEKEFGKLERTTIEISKEIPPSGCKIETKFCVIDASIEAQITNLMKAIKV